MARESIKTITYVTVLISILTESALEKDRDDNSVVIQGIRSTTQHQNFTTALPPLTIDSNTETESEDEPDEYRSDYNEYDYYYYYDDDYYDDNYDYYDDDYDYYDDDYYYYDDNYDDYDDNYVDDDVECHYGEYSVSKPCCGWKCHPDLKISPNLCNCDDMCLVYNDCCENANVSFDQDFIANNISFDCLYIPSIYDRWFVFIANTCPNGTQYKLHRLCTQPDKQNIYSTTPITSLSTRFLYRNMYCAMCNGVDDYVFWKVALRCHWKPKEQATFGNLSIEELYLRDECFLYYKEPLPNSYRKCYPTISSCPETSNETTTSLNQNGINVTSCENGDNKYLYTSDAVYKNPACYECNKDTNDEEATCSAYEFEYKQIHSILSTRRYNLNFLFDLPTQESVVTRYIRNEETTVEQTSYEGRCGPSEAYDPFNNECKNMCAINDKNCTRNLIKAQPDIPDYESYYYQYSVQYNANYWSDFADEYYVDDTYTYYDDIDYRNLKAHVCLKFWTCDYTETDQAHTPNHCFCDPLCAVYKDCCTNANVSPDADIANISFGCSYIPRIYDRWFVFVVNSCPEGTEYELQKLCTEPDEQNVYSSTPVSALNTGFLYQNMYCAMCNEIDDYVFWKAKLRCNWEPSVNSTLRSFSIKKLFLRDECSFFYMPPQANITYRICYPTISSCPEKANESTTLPPNDNDYECKNSGNMYVATSDAIYKNPACYECNHGPDTLNENAACKVVKTILNITIIDRYQGAYTLNMLFDLSTRQSFITRDGNDFKVEMASFIGRCGHGEAYDPFKGQCKSFCDTHLENCAGSFGQTFGPTCSYVKMNFSDFLLMNDSVIQHLASGKQYRKFKHLEDGVLICVEKISRSDRSNTLIQVDNIFHMSTNGISMLSLLATIFIYVKTSLHKLPGKCLLCLSLSLLVAQSMLLVAPVAEDSVIWCKVASFVMHYSFMTSFTWMNVMAFDVYYSFTKHFQQASARGMEWFLKYSIYAWLAPLAIVVAAFFIDEFSSWKYRPKYADPICWINDSTGLLIFFLAPLALILVTNMFFFSLSFKNICMSYRTKTEEVKRGKPGQTLIYLKLSVVMGLTWVFGFFGNVVNDDIFWTLFAISNGLQGLFIFLGFALNPLVKMLDSSKGNSGGNFPPK